MGWSFSITCKSAKALAQMQDFLSRNLKTPMEIGLHQGRWQGVLTCSGIKYGGNALSLGFNSPGVYEQNLLRWMALRSGKRRIFPGKDIRTAVLWVNLDNNGSDPILLATEWSNPTEEQKQHLVDENGFQEQYMYQNEDKKTFTSQLLDMITGRNKQDSIIHTELKRLTELWNKENPQ